MDHWTSSEITFPKLVIIQESNSKIKSLKPLSKEKGGRYLQGYVNRNKLKKYVGNDVCIYRSSLEYKFMQWCEKNPNVVIWSSECGYINYIFENKQRHYYIDFVYLDTNGVVFYVEIKPFAFVQKARTAKSDMNAEKWKAMIKLCNENDNSKHVFKIITERYFKD